MFGAYRTLLACLVLFFHLVRVPLIGQYAVHAFFVLSGFLMTLVMQQTYGYNAKGRLAFALNRALRLYPSYFAVLAIAALAIALLGSATSTGFRSVMDLPGTAAAWAQNMSMVYASQFPDDTRPRLSPATWALTIELLYYALICLGISRNRTITWIWFGLSLAYHAWVQVEGLGNAYAYSHIASGSLPFAVGALLFHYRDRVPTHALNPHALAVAGTLAVVALAAAALIGEWLIGPLVLPMAFYGNIALSAAFVGILAAAVGGRQHDRHIDRRVGDFSYHIYLLHWPVGLVVYTQLFGLASPARSITSLAAALATLAMCMAISLLLTRLIDQPVERWRRALRPAVGAVPQEAAMP